MTRRERLMSTLQGKPVDRPALSFYEVGGFLVDPHDPDPFNIYNAPDWQPLLQLAEEHTDLIRMCRPQRTRPPGHGEVFKVSTWNENGCRLTRTSVSVAGRTLTSLVKRDPAVDTNWVIEHLLKDTDDLRAYLTLPDDIFTETVDVSSLLATERALGDRGIAMVNIADPLCAAAELFSMEEYTITALTEPELFHQLLEKCARYIYPTVETIARDFPGRLWRVVGSEYAAEPFLPPRLYEEYEVRYTTPIVKAIQRHGGFARLHSHGHLRNILPLIQRMGVDALDPIEPPPQGDVSLSEVRAGYGRGMVLFGNLEITDIENLPPAQFEPVVAQALREGTTGPGRGFVLMPSSAPFGRKISPTTMANYQTIVRLATGS